MGPTLPAALAPWKLSFATKGCRTHLTKSVGVPRHGEVRGKNVQSGAVSTMSSLRLGERSGYSVSAGL